MSPSCIALSPKIETLDWHSAARNLNVQVSRQYMQTNKLMLSVLA